MLRSIAPFVLLLLVLPAMAACESSEGEEGARAPSACPEGTEHWAEYRLYFGRNSDGVEVVSDEEWRVFVRDVVTPNFPNGLTALDGEGQWQTASGEVERERSKVLVILAPLDGDAPVRLATVAEGYKAHFAQESVIQTIDSACTSFY